MSCSSPLVLPARYPIFVFTSYVYADAVLLPLGGPTGVPTSRTSAISRCRTTLIISISTLPMATTRRHIEAVTCSCVGTLCFFLSPSFLWACLLSMLCIIPWTSHHPLYSCHSSCKAIPLSNHLISSFLDVLSSHARHYWCVRRCACRTFKPDSSPT